MWFIALLVLLVGILYFFENVWSSERWTERRSINRLVRRQRKGLPNEYTGMTKCRSSRRTYGGYYRADNKHYNKAVRKHG